MINSPDDDSTLQHSIVVITDQYSKKQDQKPFETLPADIRYKMRKVESDGKTKTVMIPVAEVKIYPLNVEGELVPKEEASVIMIEYLDSKGQILQTTRMTKD